MQMTQSGWPSGIGGIVVKIKLEIEISFCLFACLCSPINVAFGQVHFTVWQTYLFSFSIADCFSPSV